jgi:myo-inositol-1(or 4)-monophosphatase
MQWEKGIEFRIIGCAMYNLLMVIQGSYHAFENIKGVNCWDILPGLNLAIEAGVPCWVNSVPYDGKILFPTQKYKIKLINERLTND